MSPNVRRAIHQAVDLVLDAVADDLRGTVKRARKRPLPPVTLPTEATAELVAAVNDRLQKAGLPHVRRG